MGVWIDGQAHRSRSGATHIKRRILYAFGACLIVFAALFVVGYLSAKDACAHDPRFACSPRSGERSIVVDDPQKSWAFYGHLRQNEEDHYRIDVRQPLRVPWSVLVDERDARNPARPQVVVQDASGRKIAVLNLDRPVAFYEPFSRERYLSSKDALLELQPGSYVAIVRMRGGDSSQRYAFAIGESEQFGVAEIPYVFGAVSRIRSLRY